MKSLSIVIALLALCFFSACRNSGSGSTGPTETGVLVPLAPYNVWVFDHIDYNIDGTVKKETPNDSVEVSTHTKINFASGLTCYDMSGTYAVNQSAGFYIIGANLIYPELWFKYPANVGDIFRDGPEYKQLPTPSPLKPDSSITLIGKYTVAAKNLAVNVPAGNYFCYKYETDFQDQVSHVTYYQVLEYYAPHVGEIMREEYIKDQTNSMKLVSREKLTSVKLQP